MYSLTLSLVVSIILLSSTLNATGVVNFNQEWQLKNAFHEQSSTRNKICLNARWKIQLLTAGKLQRILNLPTVQQMEEEKRSLKEQVLKNIRKLNKGTVLKKQLYPAALTLPTDNSQLYIYTPGVFYNPGGRQTGLRGAGLAKNTRVGWGATRNLLYDGKNIKDYPGAIYQRDITIPNPDKNYFIRLDNVKDRALVYVNRKFAGASEGREANEIPISKLLNPGTNNLQIIVMPDDMHSKPKIRGLIGDIWLLQHPALEFIKYAFMETADFTNKELVLKLAFPKVPKGEFEVTFLQNGKTVTIPVNKLTPVQQEDGADKWFIANVKFPQVATWSLKHPSLYKCTVRWKKNGKVIDETTPFNFGFRELKVKGKNYIFNNRKFHFRNYAGSTYLSHIEGKNYQKDFEEFKKAGINSISLWHPDSPENILALADEHGIMVNIYLYGIKPNFYNWNDSSVRNKVKKQLFSHIKATQNHPSVVYYFIASGLLAYAQDISPHGIAHDNLLPKEDYDGNKAQAGPAAEYEKWLKAFDSHRAVLQYAGGAHGDIYSTMIYLNFVRLQDKKQWLDGWMKTGTKPFYAIEMGMPWDSSYYHDHMARNVHPRCTEPMIAEYCAIDLGESVYAMDNKKWYRKQFACEVKPKAQNGNDVYITGSGLFYQYWRAGRPRNLLLHERLLFTETIRAWRYRGISGLTPWSYLHMIADDDGRLESAISAKYNNYRTPGAKPFYQINTRLKRYNDNYKPLTESMADRLLFIADKDTLRMDHTYFDTELISKKIIFINDGTDINAIFTVNVTQISIGKVFFTKKIDMSCKKGETAEHTFSFKPEVLSHRETYEISVSSQIDGITYGDKFMVETLPSVKKLDNVKHNFYLYQRSLINNEKIKLVNYAENTKKDISEKKALVLNPAATASLPKQLKALGIVCRSYTPETTLNPQKDVLIISRNALSELKSNITAVLKFVKNGGKLLIMEQKAKILKDLFKLKTLRLNSRTLFKAYDHDNILSDLKAVDLKNWRGDSNFLPVDNTWLKHGYPRHIWTISQKGVVSSLLIQRPHVGSFRSYLNGGFDLDYSALLELSLGKGRILFCQLDISSRNSKNPNSITALRTILKALDTQQKQDKRQPVLYSDSESQVNELIKVLHLQQIKENDSAKAMVMLIGANASKNELENARQQLEKGGTVLFLARKNLSSLPEVFNAPITFKLDDYTLNKFPELPSLSGLTLGDFYWKDYYRYPVFKS